jgi:hypothetical protein
MDDDITVRDDDDIAIRDYDDVQYQARQRGQSVNDLLALAPSNDPFYAPGLPSGRQNAAWFDKLYRDLGFETAWREHRRTVHLRRMHYVLVSLAERPKRPDGKVYSNTEADWDFLQSASKCALR